MIRDPGLRFWLRYAEQQGALVEPTQEGALVVLPSHLQQSLSLPEEVAVTADPGVAEEGALLLAPGHPALERAAQDVLGDRDAAYGVSLWPQMQPPVGRELVEQARADISVHHGKFDLDGAPVAVRLPVLRVGALVTYSLDHPIQEREEVWIDGHAAIALDDAVRRSIEDSFSAGRVDLSEPCLEPRLERALQVADRLLEKRIQARMVQLARQARTVREDERRRVEAYYDAVLESIAERRERAADERHALYDAQAEAAQVERARRLKEIEEKHQARSERRPFRLHLLLVPAYRLPVHVRRGPRAYPLALVWLPALRRFLPTRCPACGRAATLVAGRKGLGCDACLAPRMEASSPAPERQPVVPAERQPSVPAKGLVPGTRRASKAAGRAPQEEDHGPDAPPPMEIPPGQLRLDLDLEKSPRTSPPTPGGTQRPPRPTATAEVRSSARSSPEQLEDDGEDNDRDFAAAFAEYDRLSRQVLRIGENLAFDFWQRVADRKPWRRVERHSPLAALYRLYGAVGPLYAAGAPRGLALDSVTAWTASPNIDSGTVTWGGVEVGGQTCPFAILWKLVDQRPSISEVLPSRAGGGELVLLPDTAEPTVEPNLVRPPAPACRLDAVSERLWTVDVPVLGLPIVVRCLATWWRPGVEQLLDGLSVDAVAAALVYLVTRRTPSPRRKDEVAQGHGVTAAAITRVQRKLEAALQGGAW